MVHIAFRRMLLRDLTESKVSYWGSKMGMYLSCMFLRALVFNMCFWKGFWQRKHTHPSKKLQHSLACHNHRLSMNYGGNLRVEVGQSTFKRYKSLVNEVGDRLITNLKSWSLSFGWSCDDMIRCVDWLSCKFIRREGWHWCLDGSLILMTIRITWVCSRYTPVFIWIILWILALGRRGATSALMAQRLLTTKVIWGVC